MYALMSVLVLAMLLFGAKGKKIVPRCTCSTENKGDNPDCKKCFPPTPGWVDHPGEEKGRATLAPCDPKSAEIGVQLSKVTSK